MVGRPSGRWWRLICPVGIAAGLLACSDCNLAVSTKGLPNGTVGVKYFAELNSSCGGDVWTVSTGLPPGIGFQDNGDIEGVPTAAGFYTFSVAVFDFGSGETAVKSLSIEIDEAPTPSPTPEESPTETPGTG